MYTRVYCVKNNTIFRTVNGSVDENTGNINTGKNPIMELRDGDGESIILNAFDLSDISDRLNGKSFICKLRLFDAGVVYSPVIQPKNLDLFYFEDSFIEGDGFSFFGLDSIKAPSNWNLRDEINTWGTVFTTPFDTYQLNSQKEDIIIDVTTQIISSLASTKTPTFAIKIQNLEQNGILQAKFIHSRHTGTIFKPFLEFFIQDTIEDDSQVIASGIEATFFARTSNGQFLTNIPFVDIKNEDSVVITSGIASVYSPGVYSFSYTPAVDSGGEFITITWRTATGTILKQRTVKITNSEMLNLTGPEIPDVFYPISVYSVPKILKGDIALFEIVASIGKKAFIKPNFEFKVESDSGFQMVPWTKADTWDDKITFSVDTSYFFEDLNYEIFVRINDGQNIITSYHSYRFRLYSNNTSSHLRDIKTTPYNKR